MLFNSLSFIIFWPEDRGYEALNGVMKVTAGEKAADVLPQSFAQCVIEERKLVYIQKFIDACKTNNIELVICYSPYYGQDIPTSVRMIEQLAEDNDIRFLNYGDDVRFQKAEYFQDASHLNDTGAKAYSKEIVNALKTK